jgi:ubiquinol-cytochrome c reductase iron-sulfur subunit
VLSAGAAATAVVAGLRSCQPRRDPGYGAGGRTRVVWDDGSPVRPDALVVGSVVTVWPEGHVDEPDASTLLIKFGADQGFEPKDGREDWTVDDVVAYSKICTHLGCPVGLYQAESGELLCPCHQSTFDAMHWARPVFGPATRALPQLPLGLDDDGYIVATGDFSDPVGPGFFDRGR